MAADAELITIFRTADDSAEEDAKAIAELLESQGLHPALLDDSNPGVPEMAYEVRVPANEAARAEDLVAQASLSEDEMNELDDSPGLDLETVFHAEASATSEMEALGVKSILDASGIAAVLVGDAVLPNLAFEVRVAKEYAERARELIREAQAAGPAAAEEAEKATETPSNP